MYRTGQVLFWKKKDWRLLIKNTILIIAKIWDTKIKFWGSKSKILKIKVIFWEKVKVFRKCKQQTKF